MKLNVNFLKEKFPEVKNFMIYFETSGDAYEEAGGDIDDANFDFVITSDGALVKHRDENLEGLELYYDNMITQYSISIGDDNGNYVDALIDEDGEGESEFYEDQKFVDLCRDVLEYVKNK